MKTTGTKDQEAGTAGKADPAAFGKGLEYCIIGRMLREGLDVYLPAVDNKGIDAVVRRPDGSFTEVQIKARAKDVQFGNAALFTAAYDGRDNYWFVFYAERLDALLILSAGEFAREADQNTGGKNKGLWTIACNGKNTREKTEFIKPQFEKYLARNFSRILQGRRGKGGG